MTVKDDDVLQPQTIDTPDPQEITPPPEAIIASQTPVETNEVAVPVTIEEINEDSAVALQNSGSSDRPDEATPELCTVIAPSTLEEGYSFPAQVDGIDFVVTVPKGGIRQGEAFQVPYPTRRSSAGQNITSNSLLEPMEIEQSRSGSANQMPEEDVEMGQWRRPLCECCEVCNNGICCYGFVCTPIMLAQVMTRLKLNLIGIRANGTSYRHTFWWVLAFWLVFLILFCAFVTDDVVWLVVLAIWYAYFSIAGTNVRSTVRRKHGINPDCCKGCDGVFDDFCVSLWCSCCSAIQMARQTHPMDKYPYQCCTKTGLDSDAPEIV